jgi:hypothetical protein
MSNLVIELKSGEKRDSFPVTKDVNIKAKVDHCVMTINAECNVLNPLLDRHKKLN